MLSQWWMTCGLTRASKTWCTGSEFRKPELIHNFFFTTFYVSQNRPRVKSCKKEIVNQLISFHSEWPLGRPWAMAVPASYSVAGVSPFSIVDDIRGTHGETDDPDVGPGGSGRRGPWFCEVPADSDCSRAERWLPATSRGGHYGCGQTRDVAGDCGRDRYGRGGAGCDGECGPSGHCRPHCFRVRQGSQSGRRAGGARHAAGAGATGRHGSPA